MKSAIRQAINEVLEEHDLESGAVLTEDILDRICATTEVYDDEDEASEADEG